MITRYSVVFWIVGSTVLLLGFLLKTISFSNILYHVPPYMGPPMDPSALHVMRMWIFPYVFDTVSFITLVVSIGLILLGIAIMFRNKTKLLPKNVVSNDSLYPYQ
jgi:hypothetical protein